MRRKILLWPGLLSIDNAAMYCNLMERDFWAGSLGDNRLSGSWRFLIDRRDPVNRDIFSGFKINGHGSIGNGISLTSGNGGRLNLHRSYFLEDLPL